MCALVAGLIKVDFPLQSGSAESPLIFLHLIWKSDFKLLCVCVGFIRAQWKESMNYRQASRVSTIRSVFSHANPSFFFFSLNGLSQASVVFSLPFTSYELY